MRVIVIGGGIVGASAAYHLSALGAQTLLIDRNDAGQATMAGTGLVFPGPVPISPEENHEFEVVAARYYPELVRKLGFEGVTESGYAQVGLVTLAEEGEECDAAMAEAEWLAERADTSAGEVRRLEVGEPADMVPVVPKELAGVWVSGFARVDGRRLRDALLTAAEGRGARRASAGVALHVEDGTVVGVRQGKESVRADAVVVAAGAWSSELCRPAGLDLPVGPTRGQTVRLGVTGADTGEWPIVGTRDREFVIGVPGGYVMTPGTVEPDAGFATSPTAAGLRDCLWAALELAPGLADASLEDIRVGFRPESADGVPLLGAVDGVPGLFVATGLGANGLSFGPYAGRAVAELVLERGLPFDGEPLRPDRTVAAADEAPPDQ